MFDQLLENLVKELKENDPKDGMIYHTTATKNLNAIATQGLSKEFADIYPHGVEERPDLDNKQMIYFSNVEAVARGFGYKGELLRVRKSELSAFDYYDFVAHNNIETRYWGETISSDKIDIKVGNEWIPLLDYME